ncbi:TRAP transporter, DctM subunit [uncultured delta proteobacterium]|uniref:TRAP transporter, DctM subunit n=1 Tax=uncultured delta proteobacterium TaxID=34034 RepID=A0A212JJN2_9DELT|nr:TRAP transporter, DctM subunit [uncultured delta proteobacterium]
MHMLSAILLFALLMTVPIGISIILSTFAVHFLGISRPVNPVFIYRSIVDGLHSYPLLAVPLFILSGLIMARGGIAKKLFEFFAYFMGKVRAGMPITAVITCLFYGSLSGSGPATTAAVGSMVIPYLEDLGYERNFAAALVTTAGSLGVIIPPSVPFIIYALCANISVADMFIAGIIPGIIIAVCLSLCAYIHCVRKGEDREKLNSTVAAIRSKGLGGLLKDSFWALLTPVIILGGIYGGIFTPTEAATASVVYSVAVSMFIYRTMSVKDIPGILSETARSLAPLLIVVASATLFGKVLTLMQVPRMIQQIMTDTAGTAFMVILTLNLILLVAGMLINCISAILILTPVLLPIALAIGMHPVHFGIMMVVNLAIGLVTPPVGADLFVTCGMFRIPVATLARHTVPFILAFLVALAVVAYIPAVSLVFIP